MADTPLDIDALYEKTTGLTFHAVVDVDLTRAIGTEPEIISGHGAAEQAYRTCSDIISKTREKLEFCRKNKDLSEQAVAKLQAQVILEERKRLVNVATVRDSLAANAATHRKKYAPAMADDPATSAALWPVLPDDSLKVADTYRQALSLDEKNKPVDGRVLNAIETLSRLHENRIPEEELAELQDLRFQKEAPELHDQVGRATEIHGVIESTHYATEEWLAGLGTISNDENGVPMFGPAHDDLGFTVRE